MDLPNLDDFEQDAHALPVLILGDGCRPTQSEIILIEEALRAAWKDGWVAHANRVGHRRLR